MNALSELELADTERVAAEVAVALGSLLDAHDRQAEAIAAEYVQKHKTTAAGSVASLALAFAPALGALVSGTAPFAILGKYLFDKFDERHQQKRLAQTLVGVLAAARNAT
jgi:hypothetical protein